MSTAVNHPAHYNAGAVEVIEAIESWELNFARGNVVKYVARAGKKVPEKCNDLERVRAELQDLQKARWYLNREIELLTALVECRRAQRPNDMNPRSNGDEA